jgi:hypothetical protein
LIQVANQLQKRACEHNNGDPESALTRDELLDNKRAGGDNNCAIAFVRCADT